jgi:hypothetical protein
MEDYKLVTDLINLSQQFCDLEVIFATMPPGLGLKRPKHEKFVAGILTQTRPMWIGE